MGDLNVFQKILGLKFKDISLLRCALSHSSYINELSSNVGLSNERLEFLGDTVLGLVITERIYKDYPTNTEGSLTRMRSSIVRSETLVQVAQSIKLSDFLLLGKGEAKSGGSTKKANLAGAMEAVIGAIYLDSGLDCARHFIERNFAEHIKLAKRTAIIIDSKTRLQEYMQSLSKGIPQYYTVAEQGPDHQKHFIVEVAVDGIVLERGEGFNKKEAEEKAAEKYLQSIDKQN